MLRDQDVDAWAELEVAATRRPAETPQGLAQRLKHQAAAEIERLKRSQATEYGSECHVEADTALRFIAKHHVGSPKMDEPGRSLEGDRLDSMVDAVHNVQFRR